MELKRVIKTGTWVLGGFFLILAFGVLSKFQMSGGEGQVLDLNSKSPIYNAKVALECRRSLLHGSKHVRTISLLSDENGSYKFSFIDVRGCDFAYVSASMDGYLEASLLHTRYKSGSYERIPPVLYLTRESNAPMLRLKAMSIDQPKNFTPNSKSKYNYSMYKDWYSKFYEAKTIAKSKKEKEYVQQLFCESLSSLYSGLNDDEKKILPEIVFRFKWLGFVYENKHDHKSAIDYCND